MARLLLLRAGTMAQRSAARLRTLGHSVAAAPLTHVVALQPTLPQSCRAVLVTSARAVAALQPVPGWLASQPLMAVGAATAAAAEAAGFHAVAASLGGAAELVDLVRDRLPPPGPLLYLAGQPRMPLLEERLSAGGYEVEVRVTYRVDALGALPEAARRALASDSIDAALHYSRESARLFALLALAAGVAEQARRCRHLCLSSRVAEGLQPLEPADVQVAATPNEDALFDLLR